MRRIPRATTIRNVNVRVVFVDSLKHQMIDLKALRKRVAEAERLATPSARRPLSTPTTRSSPPPFPSQG
jgi:hypothetical protein